MPIVVFYALVGTAGLAAGIGGLCSRGRDHTGRPTPGAGLLAGLSALLLVLAAPPPTSDAPVPCLQIHHCVVIPQRANSD